RGLGAPRPPGRGRAVESLPGHEWSVRLLHQPEPDRIDPLIGLLARRRAQLLRQLMQDAIGDLGQADEPRLTSPLIVPLAAVSTRAAREAVTRSVHAAQADPLEGDVVIVQAADRPDARPRRAHGGGSFLLLYLSGLAIVIAVCAVFVASNEAAACT